jgi:hypothetical protein
MWREDDFEDKGKVEDVPRDKAGELINDPDVESEGEASALTEGPSS